MNDSGSYRDLANQGRQLDAQRRLVGALADTLIVAALRRSPLYESLSDDGVVIGRMWHEIAAESGAAQPEWPMSWSSPSVSRSPTMWTWARVNADAPDAR